MVQSGPEDAGLEASEGAPDGGEAVVDLSVEEPVLAFPLVIVPEVVVASFNL